MAASQDSKVVARRRFHVHHDGIGHSDQGGSNHGLHCRVGDSYNQSRVSRRSELRKRLNGRRGVTLGSSETEFFVDHLGGSIMEVSLVIILIFVWDVPSQKPSSYWDTVHWWKLPSKSAWSSMVVLALGTGSGKSTSWTDCKLLSSKIFQGYFWRGRYATYSSIHANRPCFVSSGY